LVPSIVSDVLRSPGKPLDPTARAFFEPRFGRDFSQVRIHADDKAAASARAVDAFAYTVGRDIVFGASQFAPGTDSGRRLLAHELTHAVQQSAPSISPQSASTAERAGNTLLQRQGANAGAQAPTAEFSGCDPALQSDLHEKQVPALDHLNRAITALSPGWAKMDPAAKASFQQYFDPAGSGDIDEGFIRDVRGNFQRIRSYMASLSFDCDPSSRTLCGSGSKWCVDGRLMWTCFGALHVCADAYSKAAETFKIETMIHESVHNTLLTTDREYSNSPNFSRLKPRGSGILSFLSKIPVFGQIFRLFRSNNDTLNNPDSYAGFAMDV
jgi:hypothetical protein